MKSREELVEQIILDVSLAVPEDILEWPLPNEKLERLLGWVRLLQIHTTPGVVLTAGAGLWHGPEYVVPHRRTADVEQAVSLAALVAYYNCTKAHLAIGEVVELETGGEWFLYFADSSPTGSLGSLRKVLALTFVYRVRPEEVWHIRAQGWEKFAHCALQNGIDLCDWARRETVVL